MINTKNCWEWNGVRTRDGYGQKKIKGERWYTHRLAYAWAFGEIPSDMQVLHRCDNPPCCNPAHLFIGDHKDNMRDMVRKGRSSNRAGANNTNARLTEEDVTWIRQLGAPQRKTAKCFGVSRSTISMIVIGKRWSHDHE